MFPWNQEVKPVVMQTSAAPVGPLRRMPVQGRSLARVQRMLDALALLGRVRSRALEASELTHQALGSTGAELDLEVKAYTEGLREVAELVKTDDRQ